MNTYGVKFRTRTHHFLYALTLSFVVALSGCTTTQPVAQRLPFDEQFPATTKLTLYPPGERASPAEIEGTGTWKLGFRKTNDPAVAAVQLLDAQIVLAPFTVYYDSDGDGRNEAINVDAITLDSRAFDLDSSAGTLDLNTGEFSMSVAHVITPEIVPMLGTMGLGTLRFNFTERGNMDLNRGMFSTFSPVFSLPKPLTSVRVGAGENPCCPVSTGFTVLPKLICAKDCVAGAQTVEFYCTVQSETQGKLCKPSSFKAEIRNNTEGHSLVAVASGTWKYNNPGIHQAAGITALVDTDESIRKHPQAPKTTFELTAFVPDCDAAVNIEEIGVLRTARPFQICTKGGDTHGLAVWTLELPPGGPKSYGTGIFVDRVENPRATPYSVMVGYGGHSEVLSPGAPPSTSFRNMKPGYSWHVEILGGTPDLAAYQSDPKDFCLNVWLNCKCGQY